MVDPSMVQAMEALDSLARIRSLPLFAPGTPHDTTIAHDACERSGVNATLTYLRSMCFSMDEKSPIEEGLELEAEYEHAIAENLRNKP